MKHVYLLRAGTDSYKVGVAADVAKRVAAIQTSNPNQVEVVCCRRVADAQRVEANLHSFLAAHKMNGGTEWFKLTPDQAVDVCILITKQPEVEVVTNLQDVKEVLEQAITSNHQAGYMMRELADELIKTSTVRDAAIHNEVSGYEDRAMEIFRATGRASTSLLQRRLKIGYAKAARIVDELELRGLVGAADGAKPRALLGGSPDGQPDPVAMRQL